MATGWFIKYAFSFFSGGGGGEGALIRGWELKKYFKGWGLGVGAYSRLGAY